MTNTIINIFYKYPKQKCASAGNGVAVSQTLIATQTCFAIDYDFSSHKCYLHTDETICVLNQVTVQTPRRLSPSPGGINIILCEYFYKYA